MGVKDQKIGGPAYVSDPYVPYLSSLLDEVGKGFIQIPKFQREFLWTDGKRIELLRSVRDGIPIGSFLVWRTSRTDLESATKLGPHSLPPPSGVGSAARTYLLDGVQRLSTLYGCLKPLPKGVSPFLIDDDGQEQSWLVCFDLVNGDFELAESDDVPETWLPMTSVLDSVRLIRIQRDLAKLDNGDELVARADALAETFRTYKLPIIPIVTDSLADATRTFQRINSQGTRMSELHMVRALTWSPEFDLEEKLSASRDLLAEVGWESLDVDVLIAVSKAALGLDILVEKPDELSHALSASPEVFDQAVESVIAVARWLRKVALIASPRMVPYTMQTVMLADAMRFRTNDDQNTDLRLQLWFWQTTYGGYFASISGYRAAALLEALREVARGKPMSWGSKPPKLEFKVPARFDGRAARMKAAALRLASLSPRDEEGGLIDAAALLGADGPSAMITLIRSRSGRTDVRSIANRILAPEGGDLRRLIVEAPDNLDDEVLASHLLEKQPLEHLRKREYRAFTDARARSIEEMEAAKFRQLEKQLG